VLTPSEPLHARASRAGARSSNPIGEFLHHSGTRLLSRTKSPADPHAVTLTRER